jgi:hypothetical protein
MTTTYAESLPLTGEASDAQPLLVLADFYDERRQADLAYGLRWCVRKGRRPLGTSPHPPPKSRIVWRWFDGNAVWANRPQTVAIAGRWLTEWERQTDISSSGPWWEYPTAHAAYLDLAQAAAARRNYLGLLRAIRCEASDANLLAIASFLDARGDAEGVGWRRLAEGGKRPAIYQGQWCWTSERRAMDRGLPPDVVGRISSMVFASKLSALLTAARAWGD